MQNLDRKLIAAAERGQLEREDLPTYRDALRAYKLHALTNYDRKPSSYLSAPTDNAKFRKGNGLPIFGLALAPAGTSGAYNVCAWSTAGCRASCLGHSAGKYAIDNGHGPRIATYARTTFLGENPRAAIALILGEIERGIAKFGRIAVRLNTLSDIRWELIAPYIFEMFGDAVRFYDYTKTPAGERGAIANYALTGSVTEHDNARTIGAKMAAYDRVAVVFDTPRGQDLPPVFLGLPVYDGDENDRRYNDRGVVGLRAKGKARQDKTGFVRSGLTTQNAIAIGNR